MPYATGTVNNFSDLKTVIESAATNSGWTLNSDVLSKSGAYIKLATATVSGYTRLRIDGGTGQSGSSLTGASPYGAAIIDHANIGITWPATYHIHSFTGPDEIYVILNFNVNSYGWICFGVGVEAGVGGSECWFGGTSPSSSSATSSSSAYFNVSVLNYLIMLGMNSGASLSTPLFMKYVVNEVFSNSFVHHGLDGGGWFAGPSGPDAQTGYIASLLSALPSPMNQAHVLLPIKAIKKRGSGGLTIVKQCQNARYTRNDNIDDGEVIQYGMDKWKVYPVYKKNAAARNGASNSDTSGTFAIAVRYDGS